MLSLISSPSEITLELSKRVRNLRVAQAWTQQELARRAGIALSTLRVFERTGKISLERLVMIASTLHVIDSFEALFQPPQANSLAEIEARQTKRQRGRKAPP